MYACLHACMHACMYACMHVCIIVLYCIVLYCIVLYCIVCIALYCIVLYCIVLYSILLYCIVLYCIVLYCMYCIVLYSILFYCIVLYCIVLYCMYLCIFVCLFVCLLYKVLIHSTSPCSCASCQAAFRACRSWRTRSWRPIWSGGGWFLWWHWCLNWWFDGGLMVIYGGLMGLHGGFWWNLMSVGETTCLRHVHFASRFWDIQYKTLMIIKHKQTTYVPLGVAQIPISTKVLGPHFHDKDM